MCCKKLPPEWAPLTVLGSILVGGIALMGITVCTFRTDTVPAWPLEDSGHHKCPANTSPVTVKGGTDAWFIVCRPTQEVCRASTE